MAGSRRHPLQINHFKWGLCELERGHSLLPLLPKCWRRRRPLGGAATAVTAAARGAARAWAARAWAATAAAGVDHDQSLLNAGQNVREQLLRPGVSKDGDDHVHDDGCQRVRFSRDSALWRHFCGGRRLPREAQELGILGALSINL